eukprot:8257108-Karenia_brevis.AAC.1
MPNSVVATSSVEILKFMKEYVIFKGSDLPQLVADDVVVSKKVASSLAYSFDLARSGLFYALADYAAKHS